MRLPALAPLLLALVCLPAARAAAQPFERPSDERPQLPSFDAPPELEPILPPLAPVPAMPPLASGPEVFVAGYRITGSTVFSDEELQRAVAPFANRMIRTEDLAAVRNAVTRLYVERGYVNSGATLPDQDLAGGIVLLAIVEGRLGEIRVAGNHHFRPGVLRARIRPGAGTPLDVNALQRRIELLQLDPGVRRVAARLFPGDRPGEAVLYLEVEEEPRARFELGFDNQEPPSVGALAGRADARFANLAGVGDRLHGEYTLTEGLSRYRGRVSVPVTPWATELSFDARYSASDVVEHPFDELDIESTFQSYEIGLTQPVYRTTRGEVALGVIGDWRRSQTDLLGSPFSFDGSGADDGRTTAAILRFFGDWLRRDPAQVMAARLQLSLGLDALGASDVSATWPAEGGHAPDASFVAGLAQLQWARRFAAGIETLVRADAQLTSDPVFPMERIAVGGFTTVRGYRENQEVRDQGVIGSLEVRVPVWQDPERFGTVQLAPFVDVGHVWDHPDAVDDGDETLASVGIGMRWRLMNGLAAHLYWGYALEDVGSDSGDLQDDGVHFEIQWVAP